MGDTAPRAGTSLNSLPQRRLQPFRSPQQLLLQPLHLLGNTLQLLLRHQPSRRHLMRLPIRFPHRRTNPHRHPRQPILPSHLSLPKTTPPSYTPTTPPPSQPSRFGVRETCSRFSGVDLTTDVTVESQPITLASCGCPTLAF